VYERPDSSDPPFLAVAGLADFKEKGFSVPSGGAAGVAALANYVTNY
jgi:hypothetical protein